MNFMNHVFRRLTFWGCVSGFCYFVSNKQADAALFGLVIALGITVVLDIFKKPDFESENDWR